MGKYLEGKRPFQILQYTCIQFIVLTTIAMFTYPGGTGEDPNAQGYQFFRNFFSELGLTETYLGGSNTISAILFFVALNVAGLGLIFYFILARQFFKESVSQKWLSGIGAFFGVISGLGYMGVAFTPANLYIEAHVIAVQVAFVSFFVAALFFTIAIFLNADYPNKYTAVYAAFTLLLAAYLWLLFFGPTGENENALVIHATGQKIIGYGSIIATYIQARGAAKQVERVQETAVQPAPI